MKTLDEQLGKPQVVYKTTLENIEAIPSPDEGMVVFATDLKLFGYYMGGGWVFPARNYSTYVYNSGALTMTTANWMLVTFDHELYDNGDMHDTETNPSRILIPSSGVYLISAVVGMEANATGSRIVVFCKNAAGTYDVNSVLARTCLPPAVAESTFTLTALVSLVTDDYVEMFTYQNSGRNIDLTVSGGLNCYPSLSVAKLPFENWSVVPG